MSLLNPTPPEQLVDEKGRPYFLWDTEITLDRFKALLHDEDEELRGYMIAKLMRQAKPDDVFQFLTLRDVAESWPSVEWRLGRTREFWAWTLRQWGLPDGD